MIKCRKKQEVYAWQWLGDNSILTEIKSILDPYGNDFKVCIEEKSLCASHNTGWSTTSQFLDIGEYLIFDINDTIDPLITLNEEMFNENYIEI